MLNVLYNSKEFRNIDLKTRQKAAWEARQRAMGHWEFWLSILRLAFLVVVGSELQRRLVHSTDTAIGAMCGFFLGLWLYARTLKKVAMPYYLEILSDIEKKRADNN